MKRPILFSLGVDEVDASSMIENGVRAERLGFDCAWISDHISDIAPAKSVYDAWTALAYLGAKTARIMLASGVTDTQRMHPAKMASTVATLDNLTRGRAILGIGAGEVMNTRPYGMPWETAPERVARLKEYIKVVDALWSSSFEKPVNFRGRYYQMENAQLTVGPVRRPPIYIGAFASTQMLRLVGELADGWVPGAYFTPESFGEKVKMIRESAVAARRDPDELDLIVNIPMIAAGDDPETYERVRRAFRGALVRNRYMLKLIGADEAYEFLSKPVMYQLLPATPESARLIEKAAEGLPITEDQLERGLDEMVLMGSVEHRIQLLKRFISAGSTHVRISNFLSTPESQEMFAREIIPALRSG